MAIKKKRGGDVPTATIGGQWVKNAKIQNVQPINGQNKIEVSLIKSPIKNVFNLKVFILCCFLVAILCWLYSQNRRVSLEYLDQQGTKKHLTLPAKDRKRLTGLMQELFVKDNFAYTILGSKPVSWATYLKSSPLSDRKQFFDSFSEYHRTIRSGWKTWKKYQHLFPSANLVAESGKQHPGWTSILIINEARFNDVVIENKKDFQEVLCREIVNGFQLIGEAKTHSLMDEVLQGHQGLIGIVLGYGRENSWQFLKGCKNHTAISWVWEEDESYFPKEPTESDAALTDYYLLHFCCPSFAGDPHSPESLALKADYTVTRQEIMKYYRDKNFLEATLSLLAGHRP